MAYTVRALSADGALATVVIGFVVYGWGGAGAALPLLLFFVSATALTKMNAARRVRRGRMGSSERERDRTRLVGDAGGRRALQVLVNGGMPAVAIVGFALAPAPYWLAAFAGALAAVTADTWATEIGALSARPPVLITTGKRVEAGRSGAISLRGTLGGMVGALILALGAAASFAIWPLRSGTLSGARSAGALSALPVVPFTLAVVFGGIIGLFADSVLGATVQVRYHCAECEADTEHSIHRCGTEAQHVGGIRFCTNDVVNLAASLIGAVSAASVYAVFG